ncbi:MAG: hypothetical protein ABW061_12360 [Polyangiaceae bacterium]
MDDEALVWKDGMADWLSPFDVPEVAAAMLGRGVTRKSSQADLSFAAGRSRSGSRAQCCTCARDCAGSRARGSAHSASRSACSRRGATSRSAAKRAEGGSGTPCRTPRRRSGSVRWRRRCRQRRRFLVGLRLRR